MGSGAPSGAAKLYGIWRGGRLIKTTLEPLKCAMVRSSVRRQSRRHLLGSKAGREFAPVDRAASSRERQTRGTWERIVTVANQSDTTLEGFDNVRPGG